MELISEFGTKTNQCIENGYSVNTGAYIRRGWEILRMRTDYFVLYTLIVFVGVSITYGAGLLFQPMAAGFLLVAFYLASGRQVVFENFFDGFKHFIALLLFGIVSSALIFLGMIALLLPGIYLAVGYIFVPFYIIFGKTDFWEAMELSRRLVHREWFSIFGFLIVLGLINLLGIMALGVGLLITVPLTYCAMYAAFDDIIGVSK